MSDVNWEEILPWKGGEAVTVWCACGSDAQRWKMDLCYLSLFLSSSPGNSSVADKLVTQDRQQKPGQPVVPHLSLQGGGVCFCPAGTYFSSWSLWALLIPWHGVNLHPQGTCKNQWEWGEELETEGLKVLSQIHISPGGIKSPGWKIWFYLLLTLLACYCLGLCCAEVWLGQVPLWGLGLSSCLLPWLDLD